MKFLLKTLLLVIITVLFTIPDVNASVIGGTPFSKIIHVSSAVTSTQSALNSGRDYGSPKGFYNAISLWSIPANVVVQNVFVVVDTSVVGVTAFNIGDEDSATGYVSSSSPTLTASNLYFYETSYKGSYLKGGEIVSTSWTGKYYSAVKALKLGITGTASAGKLRIFIQGYSVGPSS
jgi:hypothetical protein